MYKLQHNGIKLEWSHSKKSLNSPFTHIRRSHPAQTFDGNHLLNVFAQQLILMHEKVLNARDIARYLKRGSKNMVYGSNV